MKNLIIIVVLFLMSGCGLFRKTTENKQENQIEHKTISNKSNLAIDSSKRHISERWKLTVPGMSPGDLSEFQPSVLPDLTGMSEAQKRAFIELNNKVDEYRKATNGWSLEWEKTMTEAINKMNLDKTSDSTSNKQITKDSVKISEPVKVPWLFIALLSFVAGLTGNIIPAVGKKVYNYLLKK